MSGTQLPVGEVVRSGMKIKACLVEATRKYFTIEQAERWQATTREKADALFCRIYLTALHLNKVRSNGVLDGMAFMEFIMTSTNDDLEELGLESGAGDHLWAGVRICRIIAILVQSAWGNGEEFSEGQSLVISPLLSHPGDLQEEYAKLMFYIANPDVESTTVVLEKDKDAAVNITMPAALGKHPEPGFTAWLRNKWGDEREEKGNKKQGRKNKPKAKKAAKPAATPVRPAPKASSASSHM